jgi:trans-aconitate 2-methyltransferase
MKDHYTYGDNDSAATRLALLARAYEPSSASLLEGLARGAHRRAVDLGCGPGFTTDLVRRALGLAQAWGLDASEKLVAEARRRWAPACAFAAHDVTKAAYPVTGVDLFYARYLLTHLTSPVSVLIACAAAASPESTLVLEEGCGLASSDPLFVDYYARVQAMHRHYGQDLHVGLRLPEIVAEAEGWSVVRYERTPIVLEARVMARLHAINVRTWSRDPFAASAFDPADIARMTEALDAVAAGARDAPPVTCTMGQLVARRE